MATKAARELRELDTRELELRLIQAERHLVGTRFDLVTRKSENTAQQREARRQVARIKTLLTEREREA